MQRCSLLGLRLAVRGGWGPVLRGARRLGPELRGLGGKWGAVSRPLPARMLRERDIT